MTHRPFNRRWNSGNFHMRIWGHIHTLKSQDIQFVRNCDRVKVRHQKYKLKPVVNTLRPRLTYQYMYGRSRTSCIAYAHLLITRLLVTERKTFSCWSHHWVRYFSWLFGALGSISRPRPFLDVFLSTCFQFAFKFLLCTLAGRGKYF